MVQDNPQAENDALVVRARRDVQALGRLYELYYERIYKFCVHRLFDKQVAEDVTSTVFLAVARQIKGFSGQTEKDFANWLYAIAANKANAYIRKTSRRKQLLRQAVQIRTDESSESREEPLDWPALYTAVMRLNPECQTILTLRFFEGMSLDRIAELLKVKPATVRVKLHRTLKKLRRELKGFGEKEI